MRILITGGAGLIGSHAAEYHAKKGDEVVILDNLMRSQLFDYDKESVEYNWKFLGNYKNIQRIKGDVRNQDDLYKAIGNGVDAVIHTAGQPGIGYSMRFPKEDFSINAFGTLNTLECIRKKCKKAAFIYCSTNKVYGENVDGIPLEEKETRYIFKNHDAVSENLPIDHTGHTPYGASKYTGDIYTQEYGRIYGMKTGVFRMSCIYGTRQFGFEDQGWVAWFIIAAMLNKPITIYGNGKQVRDILYVDDLVEAYEKFINSDISHGVWNTGGGGENTVSLIEFLDFLKKEIGKIPKLTFADWRPFDQKVYISNIKKIGDELNWKPRTGVQEGFKKIIEWVKNHKEMF